MSDSRILSLIAAALIGFVGVIAPPIPATTPADADPSGRPIPPPKMSADTLKACRYLLATASTQAAAITDSKESSRAVRVIAAAHAEIGDFDPAVAALAKLPGGVNANVSGAASRLAADRSLYGLAGLAARVKNNADLDASFADALARGGRLADAVSMLNRIDQPFRRKRVILLVLSEASKHGNATTAERMLNLLRADRPTHPLPQEIAEFAQYEAMSGKLEAARETIKSITDEQARVDALAGVAAALAARGEFGKAKSVAGELPYPPREMAYGDIIEELAIRGRIADAQAIIPLLGDDDSRTSGLYEIAIERAKLGQTDAAETILAKIRSRDNQPIGLLRFELVKALVKKGDLVKAHAFAIGIAPGARVDYGLIPKVQAFCYIARAQAEKNDPAATQSIDEAIAEAKKVRGNEHADADYNGYIIWAVAPLKNLAQMTAICENATTDPRLRCEIYARAIYCLTNVELD